MAFLLTWEVALKKKKKVHILSELVQINIQNNLKKKKKNGNACVKYDVFIKLKTFDRLIVLRIITIEKKVRKLQMQTLGN